MLEYAFIINVVNILLLTLYSKISVTKSNIRVIYNYKEDIKL